MFKKLCKVTVKNSLAFKGLNDLLFAEFLLFNPRVSCARHCACVYAFQPIVIVNGFINGY